MVDDLPTSDEIERGVARTTEGLLPLVYDELRRLAAQKLAVERPGQTLDATALVHEAYVRLASTTSPQHWNSRRHFFAAAAQAMRRILVDNARRKKSLKRAGGRRHGVEGLSLAGADPGQDLVALDEVLDKLTESDATAAELVKLRYFAGMTIVQAAEILDISPRKADLLWAYARAWLRRELGSADQRDAGSG